MFKILVKFGKEWKYLCCTSNDFGEYLIGSTQDEVSASIFSLKRTNEIMNALNKKYLMDFIEVVDLGNYPKRNASVSKFECIL